MVDDFPPAGPIGDHGQYAGGTLFTERVYKGDAGYDVGASKDVIVDPFDPWVEVPLGVRIAPPPGIWLLLIGRSSTRKRGLLVYTSVIDQGYRGELAAYVRNLTGRVVRILAGERIVQLVPHQIININWQQVVEAELPKSDRGDNGFGSTGK